jgi:hypothetical protein
MISFGGIVFNGIFDKFPNVKFGFMEGGVAWLLVCLERFDRSWETHIQHDPRKRFLELRPKERVSDYIARHIDEGRIFVGCEGDESDIAHAVKRIGNKPFVYSSDFPHEVNNEFCKHEINEMLENEALTAADKAAFCMAMPGDFITRSARVMNTQARIGLIIPSGNRLTEPQFNQYAPPGTGIYITRLRMTGQWRKPPSELKNRSRKRQRRYPIPSRI